MNTTVSSPPRRSRLAALVAAEQAWAIRPEALRTIMEIAAREPVDLANVAAWKSENARDLERLGVRAIDGRPGMKLEGAPSARVRDGVAVIPVTGPIFPRANAMTDFSGATSLNRFALDFNAALENPNINAVVIEVDSPGGVVSEVAEAANIIRNARGGKPIVAYVGGYCCSAAYWLASAADEIVVSESGLVGCIGVVGGVNVQERPGADGYMAYEIVSSNARNKRPDPRTEDGRAVIVAELDALEARFTAAAARNRNMTADQLIAAGNYGATLVGSDAVAAGLADRVATFEEVIAGLAGGAPALSSGAPSRAAGKSNNAGLAAGSSFNAGLAAGPRPGASAAPSAAVHQGQHGNEEEAMTDKNDSAAVNNSAASPNPADSNAAAEAIRAEATKQERERIAGIDAIAIPGHEALAAKAKADGTSVAEFAVAMAGAEKKARETAMNGLGAAEAALPKVAPSADTDAKERAASDKAAPPADPEAAAKAAGDEWESTATLRTEFPRKDAYVAYRKASAEGRVRVLGDR